MTATSAAAAAKARLIHESVRTVSPLRTAEPLAHAAIRYPSVRDTTATGERNNNALTAIALDAFQNRVHPLEDGGEAYDGCFVRRSPGCDMAFETCMKRVKFAGFGQEAFGD